MRKINEMGTISTQDGKESQIRTATDSDIPYLMTSDLFKHYRT